MGTVAQRQPTFQTSRQALQRQKQVVSTSQHGILRGVPLLNTYRHSPPHQPPRNYRSESNRSRPRAVAAGSSRAFRSCATGLIGAGGPRVAARGLPSHDEPHAQSLDERLHGDTRYGRFGGPAREPEDRSAGYREYGWMKVAP